MKPWKPERPAIESKAEEFARAMLVIDPFSTRASHGARCPHAAGPLWQWQGLLAKERVFHRMSENLICCVKPAS